MSTPETPEEEIVYHYCSNASLLSILNNKRLWLTDLQSSNDSMEALWGIEKYLEARKFVAPNREYLKNFITERVFSSYTFGCCFSKEKDLLSQWRGYASGGQGACIGFRRAVLQKMVDSRAPSFENVEFSEVQYVEMLPLKAVNQIKSLTKIAEGFLTQNTYLHDLHMTPAYKDFKKNNELVSIFLSYKSPAFQEENEIRLQIVGDPRHARHVEFRETVARLSPYIELSLTSEMISSVTLGPKNLTPERYVQRLLQNRGFGQAEVNKSSLSLV